MTGWTLRSLILLLALAITAAARAVMPTTSPTDDREEFLPRPELARLASFGFDPQLADYHWLRAVQVLGGAKYPELHAEYFGRAIDVVTSLNPWVGHPYRFANVWLNQTPEQVRTANRLMRRAIEHHPDDWRNHFALGFNHYFYLGENEAGADALEAAVALEGSPVYLPRLVARLRGQVSGLETAAAFLASMVEQTEDPFAKAEYAKALDEVETERRARHLDKARERYGELHGRDIERVADLVDGPRAVLGRLPPEIHGWEWELHEETGEIVSSYYGRRYQLHFHTVDRERRRKWGVEGGEGPNS